MEVLYTTALMTRLVDHGTYRGWMLRTISFGKYPAVYIAPPVHAAVYGDPATCKAKAEPVLGRPLLDAYFPDPAANEVLPTFLPDGNLSFWIGWAYNGDKDFSPDSNRGRKYTVEELREQAQMVIDTLEPVPETGDKTKQGDNDAEKEEVRKPAKSAKPRKPRA